MKPSTIDDLKNEAAHYRAMAERIDELIAFSNGKDKTQNTIGQNGHAAPPEITRIKRVGKLTKADAVEHVFKNLRRPLTKPQLIEELAKMNVDVPNPDSFSSILSRDERFSPIGDGTWFLSSALSNPRQGELNEF